MHAWAAWRVYKIEQKRRGGAGDVKFLERVFHKLLLNFTWWVNRKDAEGMNVFQGGFLGLDNIGVFDRSAPLPTGGHLEQSDGTSWMAMYSLNMLAIALELAKHDPAYEDVASKFWEHFLNIAHAMSGGRLHGGQGHDLWDDEDGFFYDVLHLPDDTRKPLKIRSLVGLIPLLAVQTLEPEMLARHEGFRRRLDWFIEHRPDLTGDVACMRTPGREERRLLSIVDGDRLRRILSVMLDEREFLSPYGIRAISRVHRDQPYVLGVNGVEYRVDYEPGESTSGLFGGNSNWRGPIWFPINFLLIEALQKFHHYLGDCVHGRVSDRIGPDDDAARGRGGDLAPAVEHLPRGRGRAAAGLRRHRALPDRSAVARPGSVPRILPRRHRRGRRRQPPDRLDRARRQTPSAERRTRR